MTKYVCSMDNTKLCNCKRDLCSCVFGDCNIMVDLTEEKGNLVDYTSLYEGITKDRDTVVGYRVFSKEGNFMGLLCGEENYRVIRYVEEVSMIGVN